MIHIFEFMNGFHHIVLFTFPIIKCVTRSHGRVSSRSTKNTENRVPELMNGYVVERFIAARLRGADDENKLRGMSHVKVDFLQNDNLHRQASLD